MTRFTQDCKSATQSRKAGSVGGCGLWVTTHQLLTALLDLKKVQKCQIQKATKKAVALLMPKFVQFLFSWVKFRSLGTVAFYFYLAISVQLQTNQAQNVRLMISYQTVQLVFFPSTFNAPCTYRKI